MNTEISVIYNDLIFVDQNFKDRRFIFEFIASRAEKSGLVNDKKKYIEALEDRENIMPTNIGSLIGLPHGKTGSVNKPFIAFMRLEEEIDWNDEKGEKVKMIFMIGVSDSGANTLHLKLISELSKKLVDDDFRRMLLTSSKSEIYKNLKLIKIKEEK